MNWLFRLLGVKADYVLLRMHGGDYLVRKVEWFCGVPYAAPYLPSTRCKLLPQGKIVGRCFVIGWEPASALTAAYFKQGDCAEVASQDGKA